MKRPQDSDIFGTKQLRIAPRIQNDEKIDPNAVFKAKMDKKYCTYANQLNPVHRTITQEQNKTAKVNEEVDFDENYHHFRKDADMNSTIFTNPSEKYVSDSRVTERSRLTQRNVPRHAYQNEEEQNHNFGRKETLTRETNNLPQNTADFKGNCSSIFGYDKKSERNDVKNQVQKLIPYKMQWDQHDSIRYQGQNPYDSEEKLAESKVFDGEIPKQIITKVEDLNINNVHKQNNFQKANMMKKKGDEKKKEEEKKKIESANNVEIVILKGWNSSILEGLSKYCKINSTKIVSVNFQENGKGTLILSKSKRWQTVTDWLRKDAKLKIRVK